MATRIANRVSSASTMQAMVQGVYGGPDRLRLSEVEAPTLAADSVLVRVHASSVNMADRLSMRGMPYIMRVVGGSLGFGLRGPKPAVRGMDVAGTVEAVGHGVSRLRVGDEVYGESAGSFAELLGLESRRELRAIALEPLPRARRRDLRSLPPASAHETKSCKKVKTWLVCIRPPAGKVPGAG
jgi:NADPH:quinone reductase-like Zn-dependent oxidoreductase